MLRTRFPNLSFLLKEMTAPYNGEYISYHPNMMAYRMPVVTFGQHVGDNWLILNYDISGGSSGFAFSMESKINSTLKVQTVSSEKFNDDIPIEEWKQLVDRVMLIHAVKPEYSEFATGKVGKDFERKVLGQNSGCMVFIVGGITSSLLIYLML